MQIKKIITLCCFLVLSCQLLPIRQLGSLLFKGAFTEEISHDNCSADCKEHLPFKKDFTFSYHQISLSPSEVKATQYIHFAAVLPASLAGDIHTPPPNSLL